MLNNNMLKTAILWIWLIPQILVGYMIIVWQVATRKRCCAIADARINDAYIYKVLSRHIAGVSFGPIILVNPILFNEYCLKHEYGHSIQSKILGPLYLLVIGLPSAILNLLSTYGIIDPTKYYERWPESWANRLGGVHGRTNNA